MLVQRDRDAVGAAAHRDAARKLAFFDRLGQRVRVVGVVAALLAVAAEIVHVVAFRVEVADDEFLELVAGVVAGDTDFLIVHVVRC